MEEGEGWTAWNEWNELGRAYACMCHERRMFTELNELNHKWDVSYFGVFVYKGSFNLQGGRRVS